MTVRTRFAPSPTGYMHIGNLRTALYAYLIAKSSGGKFIVRIEDTDQERLVEGASELIFNTLKQTGLLADESPQAGGPVGPYIQSQRRDIYQTHIKELVDSGQAYYCFCTKERLDNMRKEQEGRDMVKYDRHCLSLSPSEIQEKLAQGLPYVIRQKVPDEGATSFVDHVFGEVTVEHGMMEDQVLMKSDGLPTYNFAHVVDDYLMGITHVVRGVEYLSSTPKYILLYQAFGWNIPEYIHLPPVMKNQTEKLSKRKGDASFEDLVNMGYLPQAIVNYIALLGWSPSVNQEIFSLEELVAQFSISGISKSPSIFDMKKLAWMNGEYIRAMRFDEFYKLTENRFQRAVTNDKLDIKRIAALVQGRLETLEDIPGLTDFFDQLPAHSVDLYVHKKMKTTLEIALDSLEKTLPVLEGIIQWEDQPIHDALLNLAKDLGLKNGQVLWPVRTALTGKPSSPGGAIEIAAILGKDESLNRIRTGIENLRRPLAE